MQNAGVAECWYDARDPRLGQRSNVVEKDSPSNTLWPDRCRVEIDEFGDRSHNVKRPRAELHFISCVCKFSLRNEVGIRVVWRSTMHYKHDI